MTTRNSPFDRRSVVVELTPHGTASFAALERDVVSLFEAHRGTAAQICDLLHCGPPQGGSQHDPLGLLEHLVRAGAELVGSIESAAGDSMTGSQRTALVRIAAEPGLRPVDLVPTLGLGRSGVAYVVDQLCDKGLVTRSRDAVADDARAVVLSVTSEGWTAARSVSEAAAVHRLRFGPLFAAVRDWE
ncbi:MarR family winged helix-turn-helix transcriptional regulator [Terrabacter sp. LjRoot27]|uniref:MarR family winged helix-turn-helix transcriptional regulator n=1 Tax=Terrabacter sp. LjRoot27 TaxID=3342306 RepID=UPI003F4F479F